MILDRIENLAQYKGLNKNLDTAIDWLMKADLSDAKAGIYEIDGRDVYYMIQDTPLRTFQGMLDAGKSPWEAHRRYIDIQAPISQIESVAYAPISALKDWEEFQEKNDIVFTPDSNPGTVLNMEPGDAAVFFPQDAHCPCLRRNDAEKILKIVMKIKI